MISCEQALELISLELDGLLDDTGREQLERHLAGCAPCQALREDLSLLRQELPGLEAGPPEPLCPNVLQKIRPAPLWKRRSFQRLAGLAACALLCAGLWQLRPPEPQPAPILEAAASPQARQVQEIPEDAGAPELKLYACAAEFSSQKGRLPDQGRANIWSPAFLDKSSKEAYDKIVSFHTTRGKDLMG